MRTSATHTPLASAGALGDDHDGDGDGDDLYQLQPTPSHKCRTPPRSAPLGTMRQKKQARVVRSLLHQVQMPGNKMRGALRKAEAPQDSAAAPTSVESSGLTAEAPPAEGSMIGSIIGSVFSALSPSSEPPPPAQAAANGGSPRPRGVSPSAAGIAAQGAPLSPEAHARPAPKWDKLRAATLQIPASINDGQSPRSNDPHEEM